MFNKTKKTNTKEDNSQSKSLPELSFDIYKMPKHYKVGRFEEKKNISHSAHKKGADINNLVDTNSATSSPHPVHQRNKKLGFVLLLAGVVFLGFLIYLIVSYAGGSSFSLTSIFGNNTDNANLPQQNLGGKDIVDIMKENNISNEEENTSEEATQEENTEEVISEETSATGTPEMVETPKFLDSDGDALSDSEELLLGTDKFKADSDDDGYSDLQELKNLYNPIGVGSLVKNINISEYKSTFFKYSVLHPFVWEVNALNDDSSVIFSIDKNSFIQILVEENTEKQNIRAWYASRFFDFIDEKELVQTKNWQGIYSPDKTAFYLTDNGMKNVYTILYNIPEGQEQIFINIFNMMINSFSVNQ